MSTRVTTEIECDAKALCGDHTRVGLGESVSEVRAQLAAKGWTSGRGWDLCPEHKGQARRR